MNITPMHFLEVGALYNESRTKWPETTQFLCRKGQFEFILFFNNPTEAEILDVRKGEARFGLLPYRDTIFFLYRFGANARWSDATFSWWLLQPEERTMPEWFGQLTADTRINLTILLVGANDGILKCIRMVSLSPDFSAKIIQCVQKQASQPWIGVEAYDRMIAAAYSLWPTSTKMASAAIAKCFGGD